MNSNKLISVIIPIYNRETYLKKCIESVLSQKNIDLEIILIDDGSTDNSPFICDDYANAYSNIKVIHNENHGLSHARNCGLEIAKGDYLFFLDSDDYIAPDALSSLQDALETNNADYCIGNFAVYSENGSLYSSNPLPSDFANKLIDEKKAWDIVIDVNSLLLITVWGKLFKKELWNDIRFPVGKLSEDDYVLPYLLQKCTSIYILDKVVYCQVLSSGSISRKKPNIKNLNTSDSTLESCKYLLSIGFYRVALFRFGMGTRYLMKYKKVLRSREAKTELKRQYKEYCKLAKKLAVHFGIKTKLRLLIFRLNFSLYELLRNLAA